MYYISVVFKVQKPQKQRNFNNFRPPLNNVLSRFPVLLFLLLVAAPVVLPQPTFYENGSASHPSVLGYGTRTRSVMDLAGEWQFTTDNGVTWGKVQLPAAADFDGKITYRKKFTVAEGMISASAFTVVAYGMNHTADVYVNETFIGKHEGGYASFELAVPENVIQVGAENVIRVTVDNALTYRTTFPPRPMADGAKNYNGIVRDLFIVATPRVWLIDLSVSVDAIEPKAARLAVHSILSAKDLSQIPTLAGASYQLSVEVTDVATGIAVAKPTVVPVVPGSMQDLPVQVLVTIPNAKIWSPDTPDLYSVKAMLSVVSGKKDSLIDETMVTTGIRTFTKDNGKLLLNGAPVILKGVVWMEDGDQHGSALTYEEMEKDVALIKSLGANTVRIGNHPAHPFFLQLCDRYGLFVLEEVPNVNIPQRVLDGENYRTLVQNAIREMILRDRVHPSVIAWGISNNSGADNDAGRSFVRQMHEFVRSLDDRMTYAVTRDPADKAASAADIAAIAVTGGDLKNFRSRLQAFKEENGKRPIIVAAYGRAAEPGNRNGYSDPNSQEAQARAIQQRYAIAKELNYDGSIVATFNDFRSDRPVMDVRPVQRTIHATGLVELGRGKKVAYDILMSLYHDQKIAALPIGTFIPYAPYIYVFIDFVLLVGFAWLVNGNRRFRESSSRALRTSYNFFADIRDQFTLPLFHTTVMAAIISISIAVVVSNLLFRFKTLPALVFLLSHLLPDRVQNAVISMAWDPVLSVIVVAVGVFLWFIVLTVGIKIISKTVRTKVRFFHSYSIAIWSALPLVSFILVGLVLDRMLQSEPYVPWVLGTIVFVSVWIFFRTLKGISVIYHVYTPKMYMAGSVLFLAVAGGLYAWIDYAFAFTAYAEFFGTRILPFVN